MTTMPSLLPQTSTITTSATHEATTSRPSTEATDSSPPYQCSDHEQLAGTGVSCEYDRHDPCTGG